MDTSNPNLSETHAGSLPNITTRINEKIRHFDRHATGHWYVHVALVTISVITTLVVPFGLAGLFYAPETQRAQFNKILIVLSAVAAISQAVDYFLNLRTRAEHLRRWAERLRYGLSLFQDSKLSEEAFLDIYARVSDEYANEEAP